MKHKHWSPGTLMAQAYRDIANEHNATVDALEAALAPIRVPFSSAVIEKMAKAACDGFGLTSQGMWGISNHNQKEAWKLSIRAALSAAGIEPCAVPEYKPEDVAFPAERASDEELAKIGRAAGVWTMEWNELPDGNKKWWTACAAHVRGRVEAPLLAEIARLQNQWNMAARAESDRTAELAAATERAAQAEAEAADLRCESSLIGELRTILGLGWGESITERCRELAALRAELDAAQAECKHLNAIIADMGPVDADAWKTELKLHDRTAGWLKTDHATKDSVLVATEPCGVCLSPSDAARAAQWLASYAAAHGCPVVLTAPTATPTDAQVEALARVLDTAYEIEAGGHTMWRDQSPYHQDRRRAQARAAFAHIGRVPVGAELDVTADEMKAEDWRWLREQRGGPVIVFKQMENLLCFVRSRIRPTYECKECAKSEDAGMKAIGKLDTVRSLLNAARAALEGE